jgi:hypothetical protein
MSEYRSQAFQREAHTLTEAVVTGGTVGLAALAGQYALTFGASADWKTALAITTVVSIPTYFSLRKN